MPRALKACGGCGTPVATSPCPTCTPTRPPGHHTTSAARRGYDHHWRRLRAHAIRRQPWCAWPGGCTYPITPTNPLTGDHVVPITEAPQRRLDPTNVVVLCLRHNSIKGGQRLDALEPANGER